MDDDRSILSYHTPPPTGRVMKSFHLDTMSRREVTEGLIALLVGVGLYFALHYLRIADAAWRVSALAGGAAFVGYVWRGRLYRSLRRAYPRARWTGLLAVGFGMLALGLLADGLTGAVEGPFTVAIIGAWVCIATFVYINRGDEDVTR